MKVATANLESLRDPASSVVFQKIPKKTNFMLPQETPLYECELVKKGKLTKNKRYFIFYPSKCLFFQVILLLFNIFKYFIDF